MFRALFLLSLSTPAAAQSADPTPYRKAFDTCLSSAEDSREQADLCVGKVSSACMEAEDGGYSTLGMTSCTMMENGLWDGVLNADWPRHRAAAHAQDEAERPYFDGAFTTAEQDLLVAQRAWIAFRDADCAAAGSSWGSGSMRHIEYAACMLGHTSARVLDLRGQWEKF